jgi:hypothetical protein
MKNKNTSDQDIKITNEVMPKQKAEKARKFPKFGVLDAVIILLVVVICAGVYFRYSFFDMLNS